MKTKGRLPSVIAKKYGLSKNDISGWYWEGFMTKDRKKENERAKAYQARLLDAKNSPDGMANGVLQICMTNGTVFQ